MGQQHDPGFRLEAVVKHLPDGFNVLRAEARTEGHLFVERLFTDWVSRTNRFDRAGEALLAARVNGVFTGIGGITIEPVVAGAVRMRRFYIRPVFRRNPVGHQIGHCIAQSGGCRPADYGECSPREFFFLGISRVYTRSPRRSYSHPCQMKYGLLASLS